MTSLEEEGADRYGAHTDYDCFTILRPDPNDWTSPEDGGLEVIMYLTVHNTLSFLTAFSLSLLHIPLPLLGKVQTPSGKFVPVIVPPKCFVINGGDLIQRWTNDRWRSAFHRVKKPSSSSSSYGRSRQSIALFTIPKFDAVIHTLSGYGEIDDEKKSKYPPISCGEFVMMKMTRTNV